MKRFQIIFCLALAAILFGGPVIAADLTIKATEEMVGSGHPTKADTLNRLTRVEHNTDGTHKMMTGAAAGDLFYHDGSKLTRLPKGSSGQVLSQNAGLTAPEWVTLVTTRTTKAGTFTWDVSTTGDKVITGLGITPKWGLFYSNLANYVIAGYNQGSVDTVGNMILFQYDSSAGALVKSDACIYGAASTNVFKAVWKSWDAGGLTLTFSKTNSPTGTVTVGYIVGD